MVKWAPPVGICGQDFIGKYGSQVRKLLIGYSLKPIWLLEVCCA